MYETGNIKQERLREQIRALRSENRIAILAALSALRSTGNVSVLPELFNLLHEQEDEQIRSEIISILNDLKEKDAVPVLADAIRNPENSGILTILVASCWQNGLDYSNYIDTFVEVIFNAPYEVAIEAFTVIEDSIGALAPGERDRLISIFKERMQEADPLRKPLIGELLRVMVHY